MVSFKVALISKVKEARQTVSFWFEKPKGFDYQPGQYAYFTLPELLHEDDRGTIHHFTFSSSPTEKHLAFTTRMRESSGYKKTLADLPIGTKVEIGKPRGEFVLKNAETKKLQVMIAGGIGITPYRSIIRHKADTKQSVPIHLIYSNSLREDIAFKEELDQLAQELADLEVTYTVTQAQKRQKDWEGYTDRINLEMLQELVANPGDTQFWISGPPAMVTSLEQIVAKLEDVEPEDIKLERFGGY